MFYKINSLKKIYLLITLSYFVLSCVNKNLDNNLYFIGDSHVARWDVVKYFPEYVTCNMGISGSKLDYLESYRGYFKGKVVVVIIGTNDFTEAENGFEDYIIRYCNAIIGLDAAYLYVYSIFPNNNIENKWNVDNRILLKEVNNSIKKFIESHSNNIEYIDVYADMLYDDFLNPEYYSDGLHLNDCGYELITYRLKQKL